MVLVIGGTAIIHNILAKNILKNLWDGGLFEKNV